MAVVVVWVLVLALVLVLVLVLALVVLVVLGGEEGLWSRWRCACCACDLRV